MRATPKRFVKSLFLISVTGFLIVNMNLLLRTSVGPDYEGANDVVDPVEMANTKAHPPLAQFPNRTGDLNAQNSDLGPAAKGDKNDTKISIHANRTMGETPGKEVPKVQSPGGLDTEKIKQWIKEVNAAQRILNLDKFDLSSSENTLVIVVQVHNRANYLQHLIDSLRKAEHIEQALLIFSHDLYDEEINQIVKRVDFCPVSTHNARMLIVSRASDIWQLGCVVSP